MSRRLGERGAGDYGSYSRTLGSAVHYDAHVLQLYRATPSFRWDGLGASWYVQTGGASKRSQSYPRDSLIDEIDARDGRDRDLRRLLDAIERLRDYDPMLHHAVFSVCMAGTVTLMPGRGTRHQGDIWGRVLKETYGGDDGRLWRHLQAGWQLVAVLVVEAEVLAAAQKAGAVDERALAWARARGLVENPL